MQVLLFILTTLGGLGIFLYGMRVMSDGIRRVSGSPLRRFLGRLTESTGMGAMTGALITMLLQSSSAVTVTLVSLVNARMITVRESVGVLLGTNVGTTITAWLVVLSLGGLSLGDLALPLIGLSLPLFLLDNKQMRLAVNIVIGFAFLFVGLGVLKGQFSSLNAHQFFEGAAAVRSNSTFVSNLIFLTVGAVFTALIQSSSAATTATLTAVVSGILSIEDGAAMVLGENIGTTITANIAAAVGNRDSRRTARIHFLFNVIGVVVWVGMIPWVVETLTGWFQGIASSNRSGVVLAAFHTLFNLTTALMLAPFVGRLVKLSEYLVVNRADAAQTETNLGAANLPPDIAIDKVQRELYRSAGIARRLNEASLDLLMSVDELEKSDLMDQIQVWEAQTDAIHKRVNAALDSLVQLELSPEMSERVRACTSSSPELERVGDLYLYLAKKIDVRERGSTYFIPKQRERLYKMFQLLSEACRVTELTLLGRGQGDISEVGRVEKSINEYRDVLREKHVRDADAGKYPVASGVLFHDLITTLEDIGDRLANVSELIGATQAKKSRTGKEAAPAAPKS